VLNHWKIKKQRWSRDAINSICDTASERRSEANDVSLLWRHSFRSRSWRLEPAYRRPFLTVFFWGGGMWAPKCCRPSCGPQKGTSLRHNAYFEPLCVKIHPRVTSVGESVGGGEEIKIKTKQRPYISRISPGAPLRPIDTSFGLRVRLVDVINCAKFYRNRLRGLDSVRGRSLTIPIGMRCRR